MNKRFIAVCIAALCCLTCCWAGCDSEANSAESSQESPQESPQESSQEPSNTPTKISAPYAAEDLETVVFTDVGKALTLDVSDNRHLNSLLSTTEYYEYEPSENNEGNAKYILALQTWELQIYEDGVVRFIPADGTDGQAETAVVLKDEFAYLDTVIEGGEVAFDGYTATQTVKVYNAENASAEPADKENFLESLKALRFVKLQNKADYQTGAKTYTVQIGDDEIAVYEKFVTLNGELYAIYHGNFEFLKGLQYDYSSSEGGLGWM